MNPANINYAPILIDIRDVSVRYDDNTVLDKVNLQIFSGDFLGVIGPNGGGKTTLIKTILGMVPYTGKITFSDNLYSEEHKSIGYLPQQENFDRHFPISILELVMSGLQYKKRLIGKYTKQDMAYARQLMGMTGIVSIAKRSIGEISGGQLQRALLCRALISDPKLIILDEPANFVDNKFEKELYDILKYQNSEGRTIIMVSHDIGTITSVVKNIVCVNRNVHRHNSNHITVEQLRNYDCPIQLIYHNEIPHTVLSVHE